jgi:hypothetical protein
MQRLRPIPFVILMAATILSGCSAQLTQETPAAEPTPVAPSGNPLTSGDLPLTEADVPRMSIETAKVAREGGAAIMVDVRSPSAFEASHIAGAVSVPLGEIERNPTGLTLAKDDWIITYCT